VQRTLPAQASLRELAAAAPGFDAAALPWQLLEST
jgi:hypothetical protein